MRRPEQGEYGDFYKGYIDRTRGADFLQNLEDSGSMLLDLLEDLPHEKQHYAYAEGKWSVAQMLRHIIDTDLVFTYRALWLARTGGGNLQGYDHNQWAESSLKCQLNWEDLVAEFRNLRNFSISLFHSFPDTTLDTQGEVNGYTTNLRSIPFIMAGHTFHHLQVLKEKYGLGT